MLKKTIIGLVLGIALLITVVLIAAALQPDEFRISRSAVINASPAVVFAQVSDFHKWQAWSPWAKRDPNATATFSGPESGEGASFAWAGNDEVGEGQMTIAKAVPEELILIKLEFAKPMPSTCVAEFTFAPQGGEPPQTEVTWTMSGKRPYMGKLMCMLLNVDKMVGGDFEQGLAAMKTIAESEAKGANAAEDAHTAEQTTGTAEPAK